MAFVRPSYFFSNSRIAAVATSQRYNGIRTTYTLLGERDVVRLTVHPCRPLRFFILGVCVNISETVCTGSFDQEGCNQLVLVPLLAKMGTHVYV